MQSLMKIIMLPVSPDCPFLIAPVAFI